jgi:hypothetical protein
MRLGIGWGFSPYPRIGAPPAGFDLSGIVCHPAMNRRSATGASARQARNSALLALGVSALIEVVEVSGQLKTKRVDDPAS